MEPTTPVYRFKLSKDIVEELSYFSKLHQFDNRNDYKEAWKLWVEEKGEEILREKNRLNAMGYKGDVIHKLYISSRYYYKKNPYQPNNNDGEEKQKQKARKKYVSCTLEMITLMDEFLKENINYSPKDGFNVFMEEKKNSPAFLEQIQELQNVHHFSKDDINNKIKKTYKNRYYLYNK